MSIDGHLEVWKHMLRVVQEPNALEGWERGHFRKSPQTRQEEVVL